MSKKNMISYVCQGCGYNSPKWLGKCPDCSEWNSFLEEQQFTKSNSGKSVGEKKETPKTILEIEKSNHFRFKTNVQEFDRVVGGGVVLGSLILVGGEPGIGKSTLLTDVLARLASKDRRALYVSGEESASQIADRFNRMEIKNENVLIYHENCWQNILQEIEKHNPQFLVIDSIQTTMSLSIASAPGTIGQIREVTFEIMNHIKAKGITCFVIGHITKDGNIAGPKILEHMVDTVIYFEGDQLGHYRLLRAMKNRFGNTNEVGIFEMRGSGLKEIVNPSQHFLDDKLDGSFGRAISCIIEGSRALFVEIQALVLENKYGTGRRTTQGVDNNRLAMLVAIVEKYFSIPLSFNDVYLNVVGGIKLNGRETDLGVIASILSSYRMRPIDGQTIFLGEVGLSGEVRSVIQAESRLKEIAQLNYKRVVTSEKIAKEFKDKFNVELIGIKSAREIDRLI